MVQKYVELSQKKKKRKTHTVRNERSMIRNEKATRRLYIGWKHQTKQGLYKVVPASKGGGQQVLDVPKQCSHSDLVKLVCDCYFPNGYSKWQGLHLKNLMFFIGNFTGEEVPTMEGNFTFAKYVLMQPSTPMRLYLHTGTVSD